MASSLQLRLERHISANRVSSALELPLDRKLGELSRLSYVYADSLPLRLERRISEQPQANALYLAISQPLGTLAPVMFVTSDRLPLPLDTPISEQPPSDRLPLGLTRKLGTLAGITADPKPPQNNDTKLQVIAVSPIEPQVSAAITVELETVKLQIIATAALNPSMSAAISYDANVSRPLTSDIASSLQNSRLTGIAKQSGFEANKALQASVNADWQPSKLTATKTKFTFEANRYLAATKNLAFETASKISTAKTLSNEAMTFVASSRNLAYETARRISHSRKLMFKAMAYRRMARTVSGESSKLIGRWAATKSEYSKLVGHQKQSLSETARLPTSFAYGYRPPLIWQTVILPKNPDDLSGEAFGDEVYSYVFNDRLPLPLTRRIADRAPSSQLSLTMRQPRGVLVWRRSESPERDLGEIWTNDRIANINKIKDVVLCERKRSGVITKMRGIADLKLKPLVAAIIAIGQGGNTDFTKGFIFVSNNVTLHRVDSGAPIRLFSFTVGIDTNSYCWSFSASVPLSELSKVNTALESQINVEFNVNGHKWRFILDSCDDTIAFGERSLSIKGKSRAALLAHPYSKHRGMVYDTALTARQIAEDELNRGGIASGFTLDWQLVGVNGWDIPAKTYSYSGRTAINSLQWIAEAAGGFINSDMLNDTIKMLPLYPLPSWQWGSATPDLILPQSLMLQRSQSRKSKPKYNGVNVWGEKQGSVGALIKRTGTSGGFTPPMVTSDLITTNDVARARGIAILSDTGEMADVDITMPLHADFGVLKPSTLIGVNDGESWVGMVRGTSISGKIDDSQRLEIAQTVSIERHFDEV